MNNSLKAALLSGLVFPGLGQIVLKRYRRGLILMLIVIISLWIVITEALQLAYAVLSQIESAGGTIDMEAVVSAAMQASADYGNTAFSFAVYLIIACWIFGIIDAFRIGRKKDLEQQTMQAVKSDPEGSPRNPLT